MIALGWIDEADEEEKLLLGSNSFESDDSVRFSQHQQHVHDDGAFRSTLARRRLVFKMLRWCLVLLASLLASAYLFRRRLNLVEKPRRLVPIPVHPFNASSLVDPFPPGASSSPYDTLVERWKGQGFAVDDVALDCAAKGSSMHRSRRRQLLSPFASARQPSKIYVALNLYNNIAVLPSLVKNLFDLVDLFGPDNVGVSIFENGSDDGTRTALGHLAHALDSAGVENSVLTDPSPTDWDTVDRLVQLAYYRNIVLDAFLDDRFDTVLFMNDVFVCTDDILELLWQRKHQDATAACGLDWIAKTDPHTNGRAVFYDAWVTRSLTGRGIRPRFDPLRRWRNGVSQVFDAPGEEPYKRLFEAGKPVPVYSCWNGMVAFDARPFVTTSTAASSPSSSSLAPLRFRAANQSAGECPASECQIVAKDLWTLGHDRFVLVPTVRSVYDRSMYDDPQLVELASRGRDTSSDDDDDDDDRIDWSAVKAPESVTCWPWKTRVHVDFPWLAIQEGPFANNDSTGIQA